MDLQEALLDRQQKQREDNERRGMHAQSPTSAMKYGPQPSGVQAAAAVHCEGTGKIAWEVGAGDARKALASELEVQNMLCLSLSLCLSVSPPSSFSAENALHLEECVHVTTALRCRM